MAVYLQIVLAIAGARRKSIPGGTAEPATALEIRQLIRHVRGRFLDARGWKAGRDHQRRLALGREVASAGYGGILFYPVERPSASGIAILNPTSLGKAAQASTEERRVGTESVCTCRHRWAQTH